MGQRELEAGLDELLEICALDVGGLLELNNLEDLHGGLVSEDSRWVGDIVVLTWIDRNRDRCLAAMSE